MRDYVEQVARCIEADQKPFSLFGHSMGAVAAFEAANLVRERSGREPVHLIVSAFPGPQLPPAPSLHELPDAELVREVRARYGGIPDEVLENPEILELLLPVLRADLALLSTYRYVCTAPLSCPITAIGGSSDRTVGETELRAWQDVTEARFSWHMLPGGHFVIDSALDEIISIVKQALRE
jgi:medium-chain acyl-[acyl-carrier-protein] hydrolase